MTDDRDARHARLLAQVPDEGCWAVCSWQGLDGHDALHVTPSGWAVSPGRPEMPWAETDARIVALLDPRPNWQPLPDGPNKSHVGRRVRLVGRGGPEVVGTLTKVVNEHRALLNHWLYDVSSVDWYVDATDLGPDTERVEALAKAMRRSTCTDDGAEVLDLLRAEGWDLVKREGGESRG